MIDVETKETACLKNNRSKGSLSGCQLGGVILAIRVLPTRSSKKRKGHAEICFYQSITFRSGSGGEKVTQGSDFAIERKGERKAGARSRSDEQICRYPLRYNKMSRDCVKKEKEAK